jgi:hypothetical protein
MDPGEYCCLSVVLKFGIDGRRQILAFWYLRPHDNCFSGHICMFTQVILFWVSVVLVSLPFILCCMQLSDATAPLSIYESPVCYFLIRYKGRYISSAIVLFKELHYFYCNAQKVYGSSDFGIYHSVSCCYKNLMHAFKKYWAVQSCTIAVWHLQILKTILPYFGNSVAIFSKFTCIYTVKHIHIHANMKKFETLFFWMEGVHLSEAHTYLVGRIFLVLVWDN